MRWQHRPKTPSGKAVKSPCSRCPSLKHFHFFSTLKLTCPQSFSCVVSLLVSRLSVKGSFVLKRLWWECCFDRRCLHGFFICPGRISYWPDQRLNNSSRISLVLCDQAHNVRTHTHTWYHVEFEGWLSADLRKGTETDLLFSSTVTHLQHRIDSMLFVVVICNGCNLVT